MLIVNPPGYKHIVRPLLFALAPETAQRVADAVLRPRSAWRAMAPLLRVRDPRLRTGIGGLRFENPIGLAAGYDKNCELLPSLAYLGFGYVVGGTVTESPGAGNPAPRIVRNPETESLVNSLGFPSKGIEPAVRELGSARRAMDGTPLVVSVSGTTIGEVVRCHHRLEPLVDAVELNVSSPNTAGLRVFHESAALADLLSRVNEGRRKPLFVKVPPFSAPDPEDAVAREMHDMVMGLIDTCLTCGVDALTIANSRPVVDSRLAVGSGGLSGRPLLGDTIAMVAEVRREVGDRVSINACGGISTGDDAWAALQAGATTVQLYTGLVYRGPGVVKRINRELLARMDLKGVGSVAGLTPQASP